MDEADLSARSSKVLHRILLPMTLLKIRSGVYILVLWPFGLPFNPTHILWLTPHARSFEKPHDHFVRNP